ncbi:MAG: GGDEF domain-containing protein, partial [Clostridia bacterium]|nr:GGDEF domain-containing protein [Clostridia bacterium]
VEVLCEQLRTAVKAALADSGVTISIGYALCTPGDPRSPTDILRAADQALYRAKAAGGNRVVPT